MHSHVFFQLLEHLTCMDLLLIGFYFGSRTGYCNESRIEFLVDFRTDFRIEFSVDFPVDRADDSFDFRQEAHEPGRMKVTGVMEQMQWNESMASHFYCNSAYLGCPSLLTMVATPKKIVTGVAEVASVTAAKTEIDIEIETVTESEAETMIVVVIVIVAVVVAGAVGPKKMMAVTLTKILTKATMRVTMTMTALKAMMKNKANLIMVNDLVAYRSQN